MGVELPEIKQKNKVKTDVMTEETGKKFIDLLFDESQYRWGAVSNDGYKRDVTLGFWGGDALQEIELMDTLIDYFDEKCRKAEPNSM
jgi:hypothetical protein